jgi:hydroxymethylpyrimidine/phosphomethylpyrimidine kinase
VSQPSTLNSQLSTNSPSTALTIAGSDSSAGAGLQADLKTFTAFGVYGLTAVTCVVAETPGRVSRIEPVSAEMVREQIEVLARSFPIAAIKTGLLCSGEIISAVAQAIRSTDILSVGRAGVSAAESTDWKPAFPTTEAAVPRAQLVVDPVIVATSGDPLLEPDAIEIYEKELFPLATLITPNLDEAAQLLGEKIQDRQSMERAARALSEKYRAAVLLKGGHSPGHYAVDLLFARQKIVEFSAPFVRDVATHGTGCTYSAAITAGLACGLSLEEAICRAKTFVTTSIAQRFRWRLRTGKNLDALNHWSNESAR